jgi:hypothetical protein
MKKILNLLIFIPLFISGQIVTVDVNDTLNFTGTSGSYDSYNIDMGSGLMYDDYTIASIGGTNGAQHGVCLSSYDGGPPYYADNKNPIIYSNSTDEVYQYNIGDFVSSPFPASYTSSTSKYILKDGQTTNFQFNSTYYIGLARRDTSSSFPNYQYYFGYVKIKTLNDNFTIVIEKIV